MDITVPFKENYDLPEYLIDFIQNDPHFVPEVHSNNLEDAFIALNSDPKLKESIRLKSEETQSTGNIFSDSGEKTTEASVKGFKEVKAAKRDKLPFAN
jgi:hypothetical protein